jgi:hypothetical protein
MKKLKKELTQCLEKTWFLKNNFVYFNYKIRVMTFRKKLKTKFQLFLRKIGMLCKTPQPPRKGVRLSKTIMPGGNVINHNGFVEKAPLNDQSFESELHIFHEIKKTIPQKENK